MSRVGVHASLKRFLNGVVGLMLAQIDEILRGGGPGPEGLEPRQKATLDIGCWLVLGTVALGLQIGGWSAWSVAVAAAGYVIWVLAYSEATVQAALRQRGDLGPRLAGSD